MAQAALPRERRYGRTLRIDRWWLEPLLIVVGLGAFIVYSTVSALLGDAWPFQAGPYLSPLYEPLIRIPGMPSWFSPAILILPIPIAFRATCYYYRRAYYRSFFLSPPACAVTEPAKNYSGETQFPLFLQKLHRYALYVALIYNVILWLGAAHSFRYEGEWGIGLGSIIMTINAFLLMMYSFGCHSLRHLVGGSLNCFSCTNFRKTRHKVWDLVSHANENHRMWAWTSLIFVAFTDLYIHLVANGVITDPHTWSSF